MFRAADGKVWVCGAGGEVIRRGGAGWIFRVSGEVMTKVLFDRIGVRETVEEMALDSVWESEVR